MLCALDALARLLSCFVFVPAQLMELLLVTAVDGSFMEVGDAHLVMVPDTQRLPLVHVPDVHLL